jgi:quaternary ammonium compound-resistance protein SugE
VTLLTPSSMAWVALIACGLVDVAWALAMKKSEGFANPLWSGISVALLAILVVLLSKAMHVIPVGTAYAVWTGIGAAGTVIAGIVLFGEPASALRLLFIAVVVVGIAGLKLAS